MRRFVHIVFAALVLGGVLYLRATQAHWLALLPAGILSEETTQAVATGIDVLSWVCGIFLANGLIGALFWDGIVRHALGRPTPGLLRQLSEVAVMFAGAMFIARTVFHEDMVAFVTAFGAVGVAVGFGFRGLVEDIVTGLAINLDPPFQIGDWILIYDNEAGKQTGQVVEIHWRSTHLRNDDNNYLIIPNREIGNSTIVNYWRNDRANRFEIPVVIDYAVATDEAKRILLAATAAATSNAGFVQSAPPQVIVSGLGENGVEYLVRYWVRPWESISPSAAADLVQSSIMRHLRLADIAPAYRKLTSFQERKPEGLQVGTETRLAASMRKVLHLVDILTPLNEAELAIVIEGGRQHLWQAGEILMQQGDHGESMFIVLQGLLEIWRTQQNGDSSLIAKIEPGHCFGEMSLLTGEVRSATVRATTEVFTLEITRPVLEQLLSGRPELGVRISEIVAERQLSLEQARLGHEEALAARTQRGLAAQLYDRMRQFIGLS
jgi:small-conductance mechanosensitive channel/CRP-like cAMP-binding protein